ncbi:MULTISPECIES: nitroreductase family protein [Streptomyces]|uniref:Oxidoreductase n=1 Tax=Streptomyces rubiginosohelvolus TaxID=67362 RepID=A0ABQ3BPW4_9ACTN|nr:MULTISPECIES: nitroreductase family protein [Streptomyces]RUP67169.1 nitroreductase A [Streptomyces sp. NP10]WST56640.1 nitroreductase family protein [Streptomyces rubiginosohelvolus]GGZ49177.1 oxidoreductase [Streptomyces pluricolorescens]
MTMETVQADPSALGGPALFDTMSTMRAMRRLKPDPVPEELVEQLIQAAVWGPSGGNMQCYEYVVVTDRQVMARLAPLWKRCVDAYLATTGKYAPEGMDEVAYGRMVAAIEYQRDHFADTPVLIVPCYRFPEPRLDEEGLAASARALGPAGTEHMMNTQTRFQALAEGSCVYPGVQNLLLAARGLGLAANITIWHLMLEQEWKKELGIPEDMATFAAVPVGWPAGNFGPVRRRPVADVIHRDRW